MRFKTAQSIIMKHAFFKIIISNVFYRLRRAVVFTKTYIYNQLLTKKHMQAITLSCAKILPVENICYEKATIINLSKV
jgi:hypothetical protein